MGYCSLLCLIYHIRISIFYSVSSVSESVSSHEVSMECFDSCWVLFTFWNNFQICYFYGRFVFCPLFNPIRYFRPTVSFFLAFSLSPFKSIRKWAHWHCQQTRRKLSWSYIFHFSFTFLLESTKLDAFLACKLMKNACMPQPLEMMMIILPY